MNARILFALTVTALVAFSVGAYTQNQPKVEKSPHAAALELVFKTQAEQIRQVDKGDWWLDIDERAWVVKRPFHPGIIDSTCWFDVSYRINGKEVASWFVDTRTGKIQKPKK
jgi:hypothetical protein